MAPALRAEIERIGALGAPEGDEEQIEEYLEAVEQEPETVPGTTAVFTAAGSLAERYGIAFCPYG